MFIRATTIILTSLLFVFGGSVALAQSTPSAQQIYKKLNRSAPSSARRAPVTVERLKRSRRLRRALPSVDINSINFNFGSAAIPRSQRWKVRNIADALLRFGGVGERFLLEGHTDAVGSRYNNQILSERRAGSLKRALSGWFGVPRRMLVTVGYGEDELVVPTQRAEWRNRRVTLRRLTGIVR